MSERKLTTIRSIDSIRSIEGADSIEVAVFGGWNVVVKKNQYNPGDRVIYIEIDSWVPHKLAPFLSKGREPREYQGILGEKLRTIRLRGQLSQGLVLSLEDCGIYQESDTTWKITDHSGNQHYIDPRVSEDLSEYLGIVKYDPPVPANLAGVCRGNFPSRGRKTDTERCQNLKKEIQQAYDNDEEFEITIKMDGSSMSVLKDLDDKIHVCSRNLSLEFNQDDNTYINMAIKYNIINSLVNYDYIQISGELVGEGIQKNKDQLKGQDFFVYSVYNIKEGKFLSPQERYDIVKEFDLKHVPVLYEKVTLRELGLDSLQKIIDFADGRGYNCEIREGVVFKSWSRDFSFKSISTKFLEKYDN